MQQETKKMFKEGDLVWDTKFNETFVYHSDRDYLIEDRLEPYSHQDGSYEKLCGAKWCTCQQ